MAKKPTTYDPNLGLLIPDDEPVPAGARGLPILPPEAVPEPSIEANVPQKKKSSPKMRGRVTAVKEVQMKFIVPADVKDAFTLTCRGIDQKPSQVLRIFMRAFVRSNGEGQMDLFADAFREPGNFPKA